MKKLGVIFLVLCGAVVAVWATTDSVLFRTSDPITWVDAGVGNKVLTTTVTTTTTTTTTTILGGSPSSYPYADNIVAQWDFQDLTGTVTSDSTSNDLDLTVSGAVWKVDYAVADKDTVKVEAALATLKADKQVKDLTYPVWMVTWEGIDEKVELRDNDSGGFATKDDAMAWFKKLQDLAIETPGLLPKECKFYLTRVGHAPNPKFNQSCVKEEIKP